MPDIALARTLAYTGPQKALLSLIAVDVSMQMRSGTNASRMWRRRDARSALQFRQAALMCMGRKMLNPEYHWSLALWPEENSPVDAVFKRLSDCGQESFEFVQLKELVPDDINPRDSIQSLLDRLPERYPDAGGFTIGIHVNRDVSTNLGNLRLPALRNGSLWFFGIGGEPPFNSFLIGDLLQSTELNGCFFMHPTFAPGQSLTSLATMAE